MQRAPSEAAWFRSLGTAARARGSPAAKAAWPRGGGEPGAEQGTGTAPP